MSIVRLPIFRAVVYCLLVLVLLFSDSLNYLNFFAISVIYVVIQRLALRYEFDRSTNNKLIDFGWLPIVIATMVTVMVTV
ncbi:MULTISPECIES: hypothetical protein [Pontibacillus]|uniref:DUF4181 domain-containing protein n=1 Tax=Pontibacillus chungwhensis TaxID=265426 RepID=A0ABY8V0L8_9BACI|nr:MULTISPECIES: hypothetical protein [Pontibacillus]MCD5324549.1 hypothetical protein [Pontibacillus sp. HN14]WIF99155.1 hypothetical protein QNI29_05725 [Pontibacillus chungwhensis]